MSRSPYVARRRRARRLETLGHAVSGLLLGVLIAAILGSWLWFAARTDCYRGNFDPLGPVCQAMARIEP